MLQHLVLIQVTAACAHAPMLQHLVLIQVTGMNLHGHIKAK